MIFSNQSFRFFYHFNVNLLKHEENCDCFAHYNQSKITVFVFVAVVTHLFYHEDRMRLFMTFNYGLAMLEIKPMIKDKVMSHDYPIVGLVYNPNYNQVG